MVDIFHKIAEMIKNKQIKQKDVCERLGISQSNASTLLNGKSQPSASLIKLAEIIYGNMRPAHPDPIIEKTILMMEDMEEHTQKSALDCVQKEKLLEDLKKEKQERAAA